MRKSPLGERFDALLTEGLSQAEALNILAAHFDEEAEAFIAEARAQTNDALEVDDTPCTSRADDGCWVAAWIWVSNEEAGLSDPDEEDDQPDLLELAQTQP